MSMRVDDGNNIVRTAKSDTPIVKNNNKVNDKLQSSLNKYDGFPAAELGIAKEIIEDKITELNAKIQKLEQSNTSSQKIQELKKELKNYQNELQLIDKQLEKINKEQTKGLNIKS